MFRYCKRLRNILEIPMLSEVKVFKDNPNFVSSLSYFVPTPRLIISQNRWSLPFNLTPPFIMNMSKKFVSITREGRWRNKKEDGREKRHVWYKQSYHCQTSLHKMSTLGCPEGEGGDSHADMTGMLIEIFKNNS